MRWTGAGWRSVLLTAGGFALFAAGCAGFIDEVSSREFRVKHLFVDPDPLTVLRESKDGDARAKALRQIKEPGASDPALQAEVVKYLSEAATVDPRPLCRLSAIESLGRFKDPGCAPVLLQAYQAASEFPTDTANPIRCEAMTALGRKDNADGLALLAQVASTAKAPAAKNDTRLASYGGEELANEILGQYDPDTQATRDARLAAVRALGATKNPQAIATLIPLLADKDVALRDRAHEALQNITGRKDVPPDAEAWRAATK